MGDAWDDFEWWEPNEPAGDGRDRPGVQDGGGEYTTQDTAPSGLKSKSWGSSSSDAQSSTQMPTWWNQMFQSWYSNPWSSGGGGAATAPVSTARTKRNATGLVQPTAGVNPAAARGFSGFQGMNDIFDQYFANGPSYKNEMDDMVGVLGSYYKDQYSRMPELINTQKNNIVNSIYASAPRMADLYQPTLENMASRGILDSSVTSDAFSKTNAAVERDILSKIFDAETWAGGQQLDVTRNAPGVMAGILSSIGNASDRNTQFGQTAFGAKSTFQQQVNNLVDAIKASLSQSKSNSSQGSETYNV